MSKELVSVDKNELLAMKAFYAEGLKMIDKMLQAKRKTAGVSTSGSRKGKSARALQAASKVGMNFKKNLLKTIEQ